MIRGEDVNKKEKAIIVSLITIILGTSIYFFGVGVKKVYRLDEYNNPEISLKYLINDIKESISRERAFFYHIECDPRCKVIENALNEESELRKTIDAALQAGIKIKVVVPCNIKTVYVDEFLKKGPKIEIRIAEKPIPDCFHVSGSSVTEETLLADGEHRKIKRYRYAPREALLKINRFEEIWAKSNIVSVN